MSSPEQPDATGTPNERGAEELERRRQSELAGQKRAIEDAQAESRPDEVSGRHEETESRGSNADQAKENERKAEEEGRELPG